LEQPKPPATVTRTNPQGLIEIIDMHTGRILCIQREPHEEFLQNKFDNLTKVETPEGVVWIERGIDPHKVLFRNAQAYSPGWADIIANTMLEQTKLGKSSSLSEACRILGLPYPLVCRWRREFPEFASSLEQARKDRAELLADEALDQAREVTADTAKPTAIKVAALQWEAERSDQDRFGTKKKVDHEHKGSVTYVLDTGIRRSGDQGFMPVSLKDVNPEAAGENVNKPKEIEAVGIEASFFEPSGPDAKAQASPESSQEMQPASTLASPVHMGEAALVENQQTMRALRDFD
jgi:hypothetical protein